MEPLGKSIRENILLRNPQAAPADIDEYERLLANRFVSDPAMAKAPENMRAEVTAEHRLQELHRKLFGEQQPGHPGNS